MLVDVLESDAKIAWELGRMEFLGVEIPTSQLSGGYVYATLQLNIIRRSKFITW